MHRSVVELVDGGAVFHVIAFGADVCGGVLADTAGSGFESDC